MPGAIPSEVLRLKNPPPLCRVEEGVILLQHGWKWLQKPCPVHTQIGWWNFSTEIDVCHGWFLGILVHYFYCDYCVLWVLGAYHCIISSYLTISHNLGASKSTQGRLSSDELWLIFAPGLDVSKGLTSRTKGKLEQDEPRQLVHATERGGSLASRCLKSLTTTPENPQRWPTYKCPVQYVYIYIQYIYNII